MIENTDITTVNIEQSILSVAERLFLERGFVLTTTTEIARQAGCNQAMVHYYFRTKELLFQRVFEKKIQVFAATFFETSDRNLPFFDRLRAIIEAHFDMVAANPKFPFLIISEITLNTDRTESLMNNLMPFPKMVFDILAASLEEEFEKGTIRRISAQDMMMNIMSLNVATFIALPILRNGLKMEDHKIEEVIAQRRKEVADLIINGIKIK